MIRLATIVVVAFTFVAAPAAPAGGGSNAADPAKAAVQPGDVLPSPCPPIRVGPPLPGNTWEDAHVTGGCPLGAVGTFRFYMLSAVGDVDFAGCEMELGLRVGGGGLVRVDAINISGRPPCNDVVGCAEPLQPTEAWVGRVLDRSADRVTMRLDVCFDTCLGRFAGPIGLLMTGTASGRRRLALAPEFAGRVGSSGWRLAGAGWSLFRS